MTWLDFIVALSANVSQIAFYLAIVTMVITVACIIGFVATNKEFEGIEFLSFVKTFGTVSVVMWTLASLPSVKEIKKIQADIAPVVEEKPAKPKKAEKPHVFTTEEINSLLQLLSKAKQ